MAPGECRPPGLHSWRRFCRPPIWNLPLSIVWLAVDPGGRGLEIVIDVVVHTLILALLSTDWALVSAIIQTAPQYAWRRLARSEPRSFRPPCSLPCSDAPQRSRQGERSCRSGRATYPRRSA